LFADKEVLLPYFPGRKGLAVEHFKTILYHRTLCRTAFHKQGFFWVID
jgi:hypothetical protein